MPNSRLWSRRVPGLLLVLLTVLPWACTRKTVSFNSTPEPPTVAMVDTLTRTSDTLGGKPSLSTARKVVLTNGREIHRVVTTGTSFGTSSLRQHIGLGKDGSIRTMEIYWQASRTTQLFQNLQPNQAIAITEFAKIFRVTPRRRFDLLAAGRRPVQ